MKNSILLIAVILFSFTAVNAQLVDNPLEDKVTNEEISEAPSDDYVYIKGHYEFSNGSYEWVNGVYMKKAPNHTWIDGEWVKDSKTNKYAYAPGYWKNNVEIIEYNGVAYMPGEVTEQSNVQVITDNSFTQAIIME